MPVVSVLLHVLRQFVPCRSSGQESIAPVVWPHDLLPTLRTQLCLHWWLLHQALTADSFTRGGGGGRVISGITRFLGEKKGGISRNWEPQRGYHWKLWKDSEGGPLKFAWKLSHGGITKVIKSYKGGSLQWSKIQRGEKPNLPCLAPNPLPSPLPPPPPHHAINNDRSLKARELARDPDVLISVSSRSPRLPPASTTFLSQTVRS